MSWLFTGLIDAEGCFTIGISRDKKNKVGWGVKLIFKIVLHQKDKALLEQIQSYLGVGGIYRDGNCFPFILIGGIFLMSWLFSFCIDPCLLAALIPIKSYSNAGAEKDKILKENKNKSGIYKWTNLINGKCYIGSAVNLSYRIKFDYSNLAMGKKLKNSQSYILKNGHSNFSLIILEYCEPEKCLEREDFYISSFQPKYNILPKAGSSLGRKHSEKTKKILSEINKGEKNPMHGKPRPSGSARPSQAIEVTDIKNNTTITYNSMREAGRALNLPNFNIIRNYIKNNQVKPYKGVYIFKKVN